MTDRARGASILIAGGGIAGLASAIALGDAGFEVCVLERSQEFGEIGAGLQVSPNGTRLLERMGVLDTLAKSAVEPSSLHLKHARDMKTLAVLPLGKAAFERWGAPYLTVHRADLHAALLAGARERESIKLITGAEVKTADLSGGKPIVSAKTPGGIVQYQPDLVVAADGVWSVLRTELTGPDSESFSGFTAWRRTVPADAVDLEIARPDEVTVFLDPNGHMVAYPVSGGGAINLVAITRGPRLERNWSVPSNHQPLVQAAARWHKPLRTLLTGHGDWLGWPIHTVDPQVSWTGRERMVLVGDAAHAMTPFSAQGAVMAIEDAMALAAAMTKFDGDTGSALQAYESVRRPRINRIAARARFNRFTWHAAGLVGLARNIVLRARSGEALAAGLDPIFAYDAEAAIRQA